MRIISGVYKGRRLQPLSIKSKIRPIKDSQKESIFNVLTHNTNCWYDNRPAYLQANLLDIFAGTGNLGIESLSRGADTTDFIDVSQEAHQVILQNIKMLNIDSHKVRLWKKNTLYLGTAPRQHNLSFLDPPYGHHTVTATLNRLHQKKWLKSQAICVIKINKQYFPILPPEFCVIINKKTRDENILFLRYHAV